MKKQAFLWLLLATAVTSRAQLSGAFIFGPHGTSVTPTFLAQPDTVKTATSKKTGLHIGLVTNLPLAKNVFLQTGIMYSARGSKAQQTYDTSSVDLTREPTLLYTNTLLNANYIDLPFSLLYKVPLKGKTKFIFGAGPQVSLFYNGSVTFNTLSIAQVHKDSAFSYTFKEDSDEDLPVGKGDGKYKTMHFGANAFAGLEFGRLFITANYSQSLTDFYQNENKKFKHQSIGATVCIFLGKPTLEKAKIKDTDGDGIEDALDACPNAAGSALTSGCPDIDGDGIADAADQCPNLAGTLEQKGCPVVDRDKDGVNDTTDACPDVPGLSKYNGCPIPDTDKDGVNDEEDACPTEAGIAANKGCSAILKEVKEKVDMAARQIQFEFSKAILTTASQKVLDEVVTLLNDQPHLHIIIEGHTSGKNDDINLKLSQMRAQQVKAYLTAKGIAETRIKAVGYGSSRPLSNSTDAAEMAKNRRVELKLVAL